MKTEKIKELVCSEIEKNYDEAVDIAARLIGFPSVSGNEKDAQNYLGDLFESWGCENDLWEPDKEELARYPGFLTGRDSYKESPNLVGTMKGAGGGRSLILNSHIDVVPEGELAWSRPPWEASLHEERLFGRGASDMKGGGAAVFFAASIFRKLGMQPEGDIILESVIEEESGGAGTLGCIARGYRADAAIVPEPSDMKIYPVSMGSMWFRITISGLSAHGATSYLGINAVDKSQMIISALKELESKRTKTLEHPLYSHMPVPFCINIGYIQGGTWPSSVPDKTVIEGRMGVSPAETVDEARAELQRCLDRVSRQDPWLKSHPPKLEWFGSCWNSGGVSPKHEAIVTLSRNYQEVMNSNPVIEGAPWATDAASLNRFGDTPAIILGPGTGKLAHQCDESISVKSMLEMSRITAGFIVDWCGIC